jgi:hypothetical protein
VVILKEPTRRQRRPEEKRGKKRKGDKMTRYVLYQNGVTSVLMPLVELKPVIMVPFQNTSDTERDLVVEIQLPKKHIDPEKVLLLDSSSGQTIPLRKQTSSLKAEFPRIRFYLTQQQQLRDLLPRAYVYYVDLAPQLEWAASYQVRLDNRVSSPNLAFISSFSCTLNFRNLSDDKMGPAEFHIMIQQMQQQQGPRIMERKMMRHAPAAENLQLPLPTGIQQEESEGVGASLESLRVADTGSSVAEGFLISVPGQVEFEKSSSTQIQILQLHDIPVKKSHFCVLEDRITGFANVKYTFRVLDDSSPLLPAGRLNLYSETLEDLGSHEIQRPIVVGSEIVLLASKDERVPIEGDISNETFEVDADGNKVIVYTGGLVLKNHYDDKKNPLLFTLFVPVAKAVVEVKQTKGILRWEYQASKGRVRFLLVPIPAREKSVVNFVIYNRDPIRIQNPRRLQIKVAEEMKRKLLDQLKS